MDCFLLTIIGLSFVGMIYPYFIYPFLIAFFSMLAQKKMPGNISAKPVSVSILVSVFNEEKNIENKIANFLAIEYPKDRLELIIVSDGSTDRTEEIAERYISAQVKLLKQKRSGKTSALNSAAAAAKGEILVFTDANTHYLKDTVARVVDPFSDPAVGLVTGKVISAGAEGEGMFYRFENFLKVRESAFGLIAGADGAIYAIRRKLYKPLSSDMINDFYHPIQISVSGLASVFAMEAMATEQSEENLMKEYNRQKRMACQAFGILLKSIIQICAAGKLLLAFVLVSHKAIRWLHVPILAIYSAVSVLWTIRTGGVLLLTIPALYIALLLAGSSLQGIVYKIRPVYLLYKFQIVHLAYFMGIIDYLRGQRNVVWEPRGGDSVN
jgi:cellulose synthase/poly-beta-1,6-N-acetylglucosamine synthase-like glycosyltransferase